MSAETQPAREYGFGAKLWNFLVVVLIFVLVGPPVGAIVFLGMLAVWIGKGSDPGAIGSVFAFLTLYGIIFSWFVGGLPAALTGLAFASWQTFAGACALGGGGARGARRRTAGGAGGRRYRQGHRRSAHAAALPR